VRLLFIILLTAGGLWAQVRISGSVRDPQGQVIADAKLIFHGLDVSWKQHTQSSREGRYEFQAPEPGRYELEATAPGFRKLTKQIFLGQRDAVEDLKFSGLSEQIESLTVVERIVEPQAETRNAEVYTKTLFTRDDQVFQTLNAGISVGQHAGGGKSLEIRRFGFNLDHGGTGGGIRIMVNDVQQNQQSQAHAHGYLGNLKSLSPELVQNVTLLNGPFDAQYGDFSTLGVVTIETRDEMPDRLTGRLQFGQYNTWRGFGSYSPAWKNSGGLIAFESSYSDGPFVRPLEYVRNNLTGAYLRKLSERDKLTFRFNGGNNHYYAAGQLPVDEVEAGRLSRFGFIDGTDGGRSFAATASASYSRETLKNLFRLGGWAQRSVLDLFSNFTFFLEDPVNGDGFTQHDSRLVQNAYARWERPQQFGAATGVFKAGFEHMDNQIFIWRASRVQRTPVGLRQQDNVRQALTAGFFQENLNFLSGRLQMGGGVRFENIYFRLRDRLEPDPVTSDSILVWQPKVNLAFTPWVTVPLTVHFNYGRGLSSNNAIAVIKNPGQPKISKSDFFQLGTSHRKGRVSLANSLFLIDRSNESVYVADEGITELLGPTRSWGFESKTSFQLSRWLTGNGGLTKVLNVFYRGTNPREYVTRAPRFAGWAGLTASGYRGWSGSLRMRAISHFVLDPLDTSNRAAGHTVWDCSVAKRIFRGVELNLAVDNIFNKRFYETVDLYESRLRGQDPVLRQHGTPGYGTTIIGGVTFRLWGKY
jgi:hypothetical protein